nr:CBASS cGAMP synthase [uncultured Sphingomonas sp.]
MAANAHRLLYNAAGNDSYLNQLTVEEERRELLRAAREDIREEIRSGFADWQDVIKRQELFEDRALGSLEFASLSTLRPKFRMQGSWSYATLNRATQHPPQEIDLDDGVFLPTSFLTDGGTVHPAIVSDAYFTAVETILEPLCAKKGWELGEPKPSCVRVIVDDEAHIDLALYAIPDGEYQTLLEKAERSTTASLGGIADGTFTALDETARFERYVYPALPEDHIMLAHRHEGWKPSDPRKLEDWFKAAVREHGEQLRRVCRYLKGWRDHEWDTCRLSSIALMATAVSAYEASAMSPSAKRDDLALLMVAEALPGLLRGKIDNPVVEGQRLDENWDECRAEFVSAAEALRDGLRAALAEPTADGVVASLHNVLGSFLPVEPDLVDMEKVTSANILSSGILGDFDKEPESRAPVKIGGDNRNA